MQHRIDGERLWARLLAMAQIGPIPGDGSCRLTLSDDDEAGRALLISWCAARGFALRRDAIGNLFFRRQGRDADALPVLVGSHLDTQPTGGRFDGVLGVLAGLEVLETLADLDLETERPVDLCVWTNEEGSRFQPAMMGSGVACGILPFEQALAACDAGGVRVADELVRHGYEREPVPDIGLADCYVELHIEQGPILENSGKTIGVVTGGQGIRWYEISLHGEETHAGPVPMALRKDPVPMLARLIDLVHDIGGRDPQARCTIGQVRALPGSINVVPGRIEMTVDLRHPDEIELEAMHHALMRGCSDLSRNYPAIRLDVAPRWHSPVVRFDANLANLVRSCAERLGFAAHDMVSGAGHDAFHLARRMPTVMIFVPCRDGISHNPREYASPQAVAAGADVLLSVVLDRAMSRG
ncbi:Zn-dependent hydrolase [Ensifer sp. LC163]|uniref:Zn-dependent hydrolase n=1 Tax=Ensifer sp. LC163 TaxID=1120652 RepID=UPI0008139B32|nr:Zn-dependent hydrolase [Ensifer sp. LC163]OCP37664.1 hypothetical protein BC360_21535 [Ensifer sp. LC163]